MGETVPRRIRDDDMLWADLVLAMERKYVVRIKTAFRHIETLPPIMELGIPDKYIFMNPTLVERLREGVEEALESHRLEKEGDG